MRANLVLTGVVVLLLAVGCGDSPSGPTENRGAPPPIAGVEIGQELSFDDHRELSVRFPSRGVTISGSLYLRVAKAGYPGVVWVHGSGRQTSDTVR